MLATMLQIEPIFNRTIVLRVSLTHWWIKTPSSPHITLLPGLKSPLETIMDSTIS